MDEQLAISIAQCAQLLGCSRKHVYHLIKYDESFPQPFKLGASTRVLGRAVREWVEAKAAKATAVGGGVKPARIGRPETGARNGWRGDFSSACWT
jgi:predicted DNA-binding transcriptional regulator AlpA